MRWISGLRALMAKERPERLIFAVSLCFFAFTYGVAVMHWKVFPYWTLKPVLEAVDAWRQVGRDRLPPGIFEWEKRRPAGSPIRRLSDQAGHEALLFTGGFYSRLDLCPQYGCLAWVMDRDGHVLHAWPAPDPRAFFTGLKDFSGAVKPINVYLIGIALQNDGSLITTFHGHDMFPYQVGIAKFDKDGRPLWKHFDHSHHWPIVDATGQIYVPYVSPTRNPPTLVGDTEVPTSCEAGVVYREGVRIFGPDGKLRRELAISETILQADYPGLRYAIKDGCDPFHVNGLDLVNPAAAARLGADVGDILVSLREPSALMVIDKDTGELKRLISGRTAGQHSPKFLPDGNIVVFDNLGGSAKLGGSRLLWIDPVANRTRSIFPNGGEGSLLPFFSGESGAVAVSPDGSRALVSSSKQGRTVEVDLKTGKPLWTFDYVMDFAPLLKADGIRKSSTFGRTNANGAYYVTNLDFLRPQTVAPGGS